MCSFEWIGLHFKAIFRRLSGAKSREINAEMQFKFHDLNLSVFDYFEYTTGTIGYFMLTYISKLKLL